MSGSLAIWGLLILYLIARRRVGLRTIEKTLIVNPSENHHEGIDFASAPKKLIKLFEKHKQDLLLSGFRELVTGRRMLLKSGRANTYYHILVSPDRSTVVEFQHIRVARVLSIWPVALPFSEYIGPVNCTYVFESMTPNRITLLTTTSRGMGLVKMPSIRINMIRNPMPFKEQWGSHQTEVKRLETELGEKMIPFVDQKSVFEKERIQREQIVVDQERFMQELRPKTPARLWNRKPKQLS